MRNFANLALLATLLAASTSVAFADNISLGSFATGTTAGSLGFSASQTAVNFAGFNAYAAPPAIGSTPPILNGIAGTYTLLPGSTWGAPSGNSTWVGIAQGGPGGSDPAYGYYQFTTQFSAVGGAYSGWMALMADDTTEVLLNGALLVPFTSIGGDLHCADTGVGCTAPDIIPFSALFLQSGYDANTLTFIVEQAGILNSTDPSGLNFTASLVGDVAPEPASILLCGTGLLTVAALLFRRIVAA